MQNNNIEKEKIDIVNMINDGKVVQIMPQGYSMYPLFIPGRDWAVIKKADITKIKRGDVVLYRRDSGLLVLHRIWKKKQGELYMVGDNQSIIEGPLRYEQVIGVLVGVVRRGRRFSVKNPIYIFLSRLWLLMRPLKKTIFNIHHKINQCFTKK